MQRVCMVEDGLALTNVDGRASIGTAADGEDSVALCGALVYGGGGMGAEGFWGEWFS